MLLSLFKSNRAVNYLVIPLTATLLWSKHLFLGSAHNFASDGLISFFYYNITGELRNTPVLQEYMILLIMIATGFILISINNKFTLTFQRGMLPGVIFIVLANGLSELHQLYPVYISALFVGLAIFRLFNTTTDIRTYSAAFDSGLILGIAALFCLNVSVLLPAFIFGISTLKGEIRWRELMIHLIGFLIPIIFAFSYLFVTDGIVDFVSVVREDVNSRVPFILGNFKIKIFIGIVICYILFSTVKILKFYDKQKVSTRRMLNVLFLIFFLSVTGALIFPFKSIELLIISAIPVSFLIAGYISVLKRRFWQEASFWLLILIVVINQIIS